MNTFWAGFFASLSLIAVIGAQNAYVLQQGVQGRYVLLVCSFCALSDALLIALGVSGMGQLILRWPQFLMYAQYLGAAFLWGYGLLKLHHALPPLWRLAWRSFAPAATTDSSNNALAISGEPMASTSRARILLTVAALTFLNPHVYLDTALLLGTLAQGFGAPWTFGMGAISASLLFFFSLGYGATVLRHWLARPTVWHSIELLMALLMLYLGWQLL